MRQALLHPTGKPEASNGPLSGVGPISKTEPSYPKSQWNMFRHTVGPEINGAVGNMTPFVVVNTHGQIIAINEGD